MPIANYTTRVNSASTISEITKMLVKEGARGIATEYDSSGHATALSFAVQAHGETQQYRLPVRIGAVQETLMNDGVERKYQSYAHAESVAWRIVRDWIRAQLAIIATGMTKIDEVMLPYMLIAPGETLYDRYEVSGGRALTGGSA